MRTNEGRLFQAVGVQHENRRAAMLVDEDCIVHYWRESRNLITRKLTCQSIAVSIFTPQTLRERAAATSIAGTRQVAGSGADQ